MRKLISTGLAYMFVSFLFTACEKSEIKPAEKSSFFSSAENRELVKKSMDNYFHLNYSNTARGARFIAPFFSGEGFGVIDFSTGELAGFSSDYDKTDFYRENNDGTVSVHLNSNKALAEYINFNTGAYLSGSPANFSLNYTGTVVEIEIAPGIVFKFIDTSESPKAMSVSGVGWVQEDTGSGTAKKLSMKVTQTPSGQVNAQFTLK